MTTDAKIGLLLGLVFIVIIAFVINGLPSFKNDNSNDLTGKYITQVNNEPIGLTDAPRQALDTINSAPTYVELAPEANVIAPAPTGIVQANSQIAVNVDNNTTVNADGQPATQIAVATGEANAVAATAAPEADALPAGTIASYVVSKGDTLLSIAIKFYGQDGKKKVNVDKIVKANDLKSAAKISIGQKLVIPAPEKSLDQMEPSLFEKVENMGKKALGMNKSPDAAKPTQIAAKQGDVARSDNEYTIQSGDNPWKIAAKTLGNGNRYKEILKLNPQLKSSNMKVGSKIKIPKK